MKRLLCVIALCGLCVGCAELKEFGATVGDGLSDVVAEAGEALKAGAGAAVDALPEASEKVVENPTPAGAGNAVLYIVGTFLTGVVGYYGYKKVRKS